MIYLAIPPTRAWIPTIRWATEEDPVVKEAKNFASYYNRDNEG